MVENIEIYFAENPNTPPRTTKDTAPKERMDNWNKRINKANEQAKLNPIPYSQVFSLVNEFLEMTVHKASGANDKNTKVDILSLDVNNQAIILDNGIIAKGCNWVAPKWDEAKHNYTSWDEKYNSIKEKFQLTYPSDIIWLKFTKKYRLGVVAKSFDINFDLGNSSGKLVKEVDEEWDNSFVYIFPLTKDILKGRKTGDIERAVGNYLIAKGVPIIDFYSHNY